MRSKTRIQQKGTEEGRLLKGTETKRELTRKLATGAGRIEKTAREDRAENRARDRGHKRAAEDNKWKTWRTGTNKKTTK